MEMGIKPFIYQILVVLFIWSGMTFFKDEIFGVGKIIYYGTTSWLLFLIVITVRKIISDRRKRKKEPLN